MLNTYPIHTLNLKIQELQKERQRIMNTVELFDDTMTTQVYERIDTHIYSLETAVKLLTEFTQE